MPYSFGINVASDVFNIICKKKKKSSGNCVGETEWGIWSFVILSYLKWEGLSSLKNRWEELGLNGNPQFSSHGCDYRKNIFDLPIMLTAKFLDQGLWDPLEYKSWKALICLFTPTPQLCPNVNIHIFNVNEYN